MTPPFVRVLTTRVTRRPAADRRAGGRPAAQASIRCRSSSTTTTRSSAPPPTTRPPASSLFGIPTAAPKLKAGKTNAIVAASDYQEAKNINTVGNDDLSEHDLPAVEADGRRTARPSRGSSRPHTSAPLKSDRLVVVGGVDEEDQATSPSVTTASAIGVDKIGPGGVYSRRVEDEQPARRASTTCWRRVDRRVGPPRRGRPAAEDLQVAVVTGATPRDRRELVRALQARGMLVVGLSRRAVGRRRARGVRRRRPRRRSTRPRHACSSAIRASTCSSTTPASARARASSTAAPETDRAGDATSTTSGRSGRRSHSCPASARARTSSTSSRSRAPSPSGPYSASKHAQLAFSRSLAVELAPRGIMVHTVNPGFVETAGFPQRGRFRPALHRLVIEPELVVERLLGAVDKGSARSSSRAGIARRRGCRPWRPGRHIAAREHVPADDGLVPLGARLRARSRSGPSQPARSRYASRSRGSWIDLLTAQDEVVRVEQPAQVDVGEQTRRRGVACVLEPCQLDRRERVVGASWSTTRIVPPGLA